ncbi:MAG: DnaJ domain-containing protein [Desulfobacteraceae bacterium]|nr:DnaJ domain-containing protein [Desulfobacteraceae bacterium]
MSWIGKMIGGTLGFALGGPLGAVAGAAFGHAFVDKKEDIYLKSIPGSHNRLSSNEQAQLIFFTAAFSMLAKISKADGKITQGEIDTVEAFMDNDLRLDSHSRESAINIFRHAIESTEPFDAFAIQFYTVFKHQPNLIEVMMELLFRVSASDGNISSEEESMLLSAKRIFSYPDYSYERLKSKYINNINKFYALLNCNENATNEEIKKQYRKLATEYHPDKIEAKGLPEEFIKLATEKFKEVQEAYDHIKKERGL